MDRLARAPIDRFLTLYIKAPITSAGCLRWHLSACLSSFIMLPDPSRLHEALLIAREQIAKQQAIIEAQNELILYAFSDGPGPIDEEAGGRRGDGCVLPWTPSARSRRLHSFDA